MTYNKPFVTTITSRLPLPTTRRLTSFNIPVENGYDVLADVNASGENIAYPPAQLPTPPLTPKKPRTTRTRLLNSSSSPFLVNIHDLLPKDERPHTPTTCTTPTTTTKTHLHRGDVEVVVVRGASVVGGAGGKDGKNTVTIDGIEAVIPDGGVNSSRTNTRRLLPPFAQAAEAAPSTPAHSSSTEDEEVPLLWEETPPPSYYYSLPPTPRTPPTPHPHPIHSLSDFLITSLPPTPLPTPPTPQPPIEAFVLDLEDPTPLPSLSPSPSPTDATTEVADPIWDLLRAFSRASAPTAAKPAIVERGVEGGVEVVGIVGGEEEVVGGVGGEE
ncbi:hypothetical protein HDV00_003618, partial [Rhizophlyctis rosea]